MWFHYKLVLDAMNYFSPAQEPSRVPSLSRHRHSSNKADLAMKKDAHRFLLQKRYNPWGSYTLPKVDKPDETRFEALQ